MAIWLCSYSIIKYEGVGRYLIEGIGSIQETNQYNPNATTSPTNRNLGTWIQYADKTER